MDTATVDKFKDLAQQAIDDAYALAQEALNDGKTINHAERQITKMDNWLKVGHHAATASPF